MRGRWVSCLCKVGGKGLLEEESPRVSSQHSVSEAGLYLSCSRNNKEPVSGADRVLESHRKEDSEQQQRRDQDLWLFL